MLFFLIILSPSAMRFFFGLDMPISSMQQWGCDVKHFMRKPFELRLAFRSLVCNVQYTIHRIFSRSIWKYWKHHREHTHKPSYSYQLTIQLNIGNFLHARKCSAFDRIWKKFLFLDFLDVYRFLWNKNSSVPFIEGFHTFNSFWDIFPHNLIIFKNFLCVSLTVRVLWLYVSLNLYNVIKMASYFLWFFFMHHFFIQKEI